MSRPGSGWPADQKCAPILRLLTRQWRVRAAAGSGAQIQPPKGRRAVRWRPVNEMDDPVWLGRFPLGAERAPFPLLEERS